jgi:serine phosphatase RsbU (regulator of sigma subunit)/pSer/pThr/pTyr-binding forkhead associated (FHA) protein
MLRLYVVPAQGEPFEHVFEEQELVIGRASDSGLAIADRFLSRHHARLFRGADERVLIEDLGSRNGTLLNGEPISEPTTVRPGDHLKLSGSLITVSDGTSATGSSRSDATIFRRAKDLLEDSSRQRISREDAVAMGRYAERLELLNEVHQALSRSISMQQLLELILDRAFDALRPQQGVIYLRNAAGELYAAARRSLPEAGPELPWSRSLAREVVDKGLAALVLDAQTDERFASAKSILTAGVRSLVAAPLLDGDTALGMIALDSKIAVRQFTEEDMDLLVSLAAVAALRVRNLALTEDAAQRRRLEEELTLARRIQLALLPDRLPEVPGWHIHGRNLPSRGVSGDYFQVLERRSRAGAAETVLMVADVSGKGIGASLLTAALESLAAAPIEDGLACDAIFTRLSRMLHARTPPEKYATALLAILDPASGELCYANAGHNPALVVRAGGEACELAATGMPLGLVANASYRADEVRLGEGDLLVLYTDGITEAVDPSGEEYGLARLLEVVRRGAALPLAGLGAAIEADLDAFAAGAPFHDDRTYVLARRDPSR